MEAAAYRSALARTGKDPKETVNASVFAAKGTATKSFGGADRRYRVNNLDGEALPFRLVRRGGLGRKMFKTILLGRKRDLLSGLRSGGRD